MVDPAGFLKDWRSF